MRSSVVGFLDLSGDLHGIQGYDFSRVLAALPRVQARLLLIVSNVWEYRRMPIAPLTMSVVRFGQNNDKHVYYIESSHPNFSALVADYARLPVFCGFVRSALAVVFMKRDDLSAADIMQALVLSYPQ